MSVIVLTIDYARVSWVDIKMYKCDKSSMILNNTLSHGVGIIHHYIIKLGRIKAQTDTPVRHWIRSMTPGREGTFGSEVGQIGPKWDKSGFFQIIFQCICQMVQIRGFFRSDFSAFGAGAMNLTWKKTGFVPFGANLTHFGAKSTIPGPCQDEYVTRIDTSLVDSLSMTSLFDRYASK